MNHSVFSPHRPPVGSPIAPVLRAVLLADLVDSTAFIQSFGDARAAVALQRLDLQIRDLLEFTGGRLIDKADGLLAIFGRPVQAVDFALRYQQALRHFSSSEGSVLTARVGIHVGEVMTWSNPAAAVAAGAKPLEVEGLAKPVAARLMALALPGQILMSSMAQSLARRAQAELGERGERLRWLVHGRYRFKGVPAPWLVHEVGEVGFAPLREPLSSLKVWREVPIWRRPPVLAAELMLCLAVGSFYAYSLLRSPPAIGFQPRDWVVVGDLSNFTGDPRLEDSLETALRIGLEQSRYVNVVPDLKVRSALDRMGRASQTSIDRAIGSEIAVREGARALLLPAVAEVGGRLRVSIEVVDPNHQATVFVASAEGSGAESALASIDAVNGQLRKNLGESMRDITTDGKPLAQVTTTDLEALRAYSLAQTASRTSRHLEARALYERALELDPKFAMAQVGMARLDAKNEDMKGAWRMAMQANGNRQRLTRPEALQLDAFISRFGPASESLPKYKLWASLYPDSYRAYYEYSYIAWGGQMYQEALEYLTPALSRKNSNRGNAYYLQGSILLSLNRYPEARSAFGQSEAMGVGGEKREYAETYAAERDFAGASRTLKLQTIGGMAGADLRTSTGDPVFLLDQGRWPEALAAQLALERRAQLSSPFRARALRGTRISMSHYLGQLGPGQLRDYLADEGGLLRLDAGLERDHAIFATLAGGWLAARQGDLQAARAALAGASQLVSERSDAALVGMQAILQAELALSAGQPGAAIAALRATQDGSELYFSHAVLMRAYAADADYAAALGEADWLVGQRGRAYAEWNSMEMWSAANVAESDLALLGAAEFALKLDQPKLAKQRLAAFMRVWPTAGRLPSVAPRLRAVRDALRSTAGQRS